LRSQSQRFWGSWAIRFAESEKSVIRLFPICKQITFNSLGIQTQFASSK